MNVDEVGVERTVSFLRVDTVVSVETAESILAKFDVLIEKLKTDGAKERSANQSVARAVRTAAAFRAKVQTGLVSVGDTAVGDTADDLAETDLVNVKAEAKSQPTQVEVVSDAPEQILQVRGLVKHFGETTAVAGIDLSVRAGTIFGIVGPNGAGKTTTLSMMTGLLRPDSGTVIVHGADVWQDPAAAKRQMGILPDRLRLFDRLTGRQLLFYVGVLRGLPAGAVQERIAQLATSFGLENALGRLVADYSAGMTKKLSLAAALIHSPRMLVLDEPFESVDPVSTVKIIETLKKYVAAGGTVVLSSHSIDLIERVCDSVAIITDGAVLASGPMKTVCGSGTLEEKFVELAGGDANVKGLSWLHSFSD